MQSRSACKSEENALPDEAEDSVAGHYKRNSFHTNNESSRKVSSQCVIPALIPGLEVCVFVCARVCVCVRGRRRLVLVSETATEECSMCWCRQGFVSVARRVKTSCLSSAGADGTRSAALSSVTSTGSTMYPVVCRDGQTDRPLDG